MLCAILEETARPPLDRLRSLVHAFVRSEWEEAVCVFMREVLPSSPDGTRALAADLLTDTLSAVGKQFSERPRTPGEIAAYADALADMLCAWL